MNNDLTAYRREFPVTEKYVYLDHAGIAPLSLRAKAAVEQYLNESTEGGAFHYPAWAQRIAGVRRSCGRLVNADPDEIAFVKSTSHGISIAAEGLDWHPGENVIIYEKEFPSNIYPWMHLRRRGVEVRVVPSRSGRIMLEDIKALIDGKTRLVALSAVQFTNGYRVDLRAVGSLCRERGVLLFVDAIQALGAVSVDVRDAGISFLSADAHKWLLGPEGAGIFYCRRDLAERLDPPLVGWKSVQKDHEFEKPDLQFKKDALRFEEGSQNLPGIFGLGAAVGLLLEAGIDRIEDRVLGLGGAVIDQARSRGLTVLTPESRSERAGIVTLSGGFDAAEAQHALREQGILVNVRGGGLRVSPHFYNTGEDIAAFFDGLDRFRR